MPRLIRADVLRPAGGVQRLRVVATIEGAPRIRRDEGLHRGLHVVVQPEGPRRAALARPHDPDATLEVYVARFGTLQLRGTYARGRDDHEPRLNLRIDQVRRHR